MSNSDLNTRKQNIAAPTVEEALAKGDEKSVASANARAGRVTIPDGSKGSAKTKTGGKTKESKAEARADKKPTRIRDSFTFPVGEYAQFAVLKQRALKAGREVKKGELLRAALIALSALSDAALLKALGKTKKP